MTPTQNHDASNTGKAVAAAAAVKAASHLNVPARIGLGVVGAVQIAFAVLAFWDLALRDKREVRGPKPVWIPVILVNWIGPASYFLFGIEHARSRKR